MTLYITLFHTTMESNSENDELMVEKKELKTTDYYSNNFFRKTLSLRIVPLFFIAVKTLNRKNEAHKATNYGPKKCA